ncbi:MAG: oligopeptidase B, partial [Burkholderiaceae bacterium]
MNVPASLPSTAVAAEATPLVAAPVAAKKPHVVESPNGDREDPYYWLRDDTRQDPEMLAYLGAENAWFAQYSARSKGLEDKLFDEIKGRIKQDDSTVPAKKGDWWYYTRFVEGREYPVYARRQSGATYSEAASELVMLDVNALASGHDFFQVGGMDVSPSQKMLAYAEDTVG